MSKNNPRIKTKLLKSWKTSDIRIESNSKGNWVVFGKKKVKVPDDLVPSKMSLKQTEGLLGIERAMSDLVDEIEQNKRGAPSLYREEYNEQARKLCLLGATDSELADFFGVTEQTINNWKTEFSDFFESIKKGKNYADANVADRLYNRALGYEHDEEKIFNDQGVALRVDTVKHYPPDTAAAIFWLKNRQPAKWREKAEVDHTTKGDKIESAPARILTKQEAKGLLNDLENEY